MADTAFSWEINPLAANGVVVAFDLTLVAQNGELRLTQGGRYDLPTEEHKPAKEWTAKAARELAEKVSTERGWKAKLANRVAEAVKAADLKPATIKGL